jgi:hypothetical protein
MERRNPQIVTHHHLQGSDLLTYSDTRVSRNGLSIPSVVSLSPFFLLGVNEIASA